MGFFDAIGDAAEYVGGSFSSAPSERDFLQGVIGTVGDLAIKRTVAHYSEKSLPPAQVTTAPAGTAAGNNSMLGLSAKSLLIVGGIVALSIAVALGLSMVGGKK